MTAWRRFRSKLPRRKLGPDGQFESLLDPGVVAIVASVVLNPFLLAWLAGWVVKEVLPVGQRSLVGQTVIFTFLVSMLITASLSLYAIATGIPARNRRCLTLGVVAIVICIVLPMLGAAVIAGLGAMTAAATMRN